MSEHRPINGSGSCARCQAGLGLASHKRCDIWYCSSACADGRDAPTSDAHGVPEPWLYARPRRFFRARKPKELKSTRSTD